VLPRKIGDTREEIKNIVYQIESKLFEAGKYYAKALGIEYINPSNLSFSKYAQGKTMGPHVDSYDTPGVYPLMSGVIYLNESDGGELDFPEQNVRIKPKAGSIVIFPSVAPFYHQSLPIQSGWKYIAPVFWVKRDS
jgi:predicted 2-oxoglutarate/Fe(II)-dependent dioxygenase YbiX